MLLTCLSVLALAAGDWKSTFVPEATASYLDRPNASVLVLGGGESNDRRREAEDALVSALRASGKTRLVMTGEGLTVTSADPDAALIKKAAVLPIDLVLILRLFPGQTETAVVTLYDKSGATLGALAANPGVTLLPHEGGLGQAAGRATVVGIVKGRDDDDAPRASQPKPDPEKIAIGNKVRPQLHDGKVIGSWKTPSYGGKALTDARFYELAGTPDVLGRYRGRVALKVSLIAVGGAVSIAGLVVGIATLSPPCAVFDSRISTCVQYQYSSLFLPGLISSVVGLAALIVGAAINPHPISEKERLQLVDDFNAKVDARRDADSEPEPAPTHAPEVSLSRSPGGFALSF